MSESTLTHADNGKTVQLRPGEQFRLRLAENPTTGYVWAVDELDAEILVQIGSEYETAPKTGTGGGGQRTFTYQALAAGTTQLRLKLWRHWEGDSSTRERFAATVLVQA